MDKMDKTTDPACAELEEYTYAEHRFRFAAWAAGSALRGEKNDDARKILKEAGFCELAKQGVKWLPDPDPKIFDKKHHIWCNKVLDEAKRLEKGWFYGRSAKLINVFLKALMPANLEDAGFPAEEKAKWDAVHPPIDSIVLGGMEEHGIGDSMFWNSLPYRWDYSGGNRKKKYTWTKFSYEQYQSVIDMIRCNLIKCGYTDPLPLWRNERFFKP